MSDQVEDARRFISRLSLVVGAVALAVGVLVPGFVAEPFPRALIQVASVWLGVMAGIFMGYGRYSSGADLRRNFAIGPAPRPSVTREGVKGAVLRCPGVTKVLVFDDPEVRWHFAVVAWGGDEADVRAAVASCKAAELAALVHVRSAGR